MKKLGVIIDNLKKGNEAPTRHHNPYLTEALALDEFLFTQQEITTQKNIIFKNQNTKIVLEIGCYMGKNTLEFAQQNPCINFLGLDITYKRVVKAARKLKNQNITNAKIIFCDGETFLSDYCSDNSLDGICIFFPDPWPKDRHAKNRLLKENFIKLLYQKLKPKGFFWFKTDSQIYFDETFMLLKKIGLYLEPVVNDSKLNQPSDLQGGPYETPFQKIFTLKKVPFWQGIYIKP